LAVTLNLNLKQFRGEIRGLGRRVSQRRTRILKWLADRLLGFAVQKAPRDTGSLAGSEFVRQLSDGTIIFGFSAAYAVFQDGAGISFPVTIVPRRKKMLYVPLTRAGKLRHRY
jgi:hypothetical protein